MIMHDYAPYFEREPEWQLSTAGWFWFAYMCGINSVVILLTVYAYADAIRQAVGL